MIVTIIYKLIMVGVLVYCVKLTYSSVKELFEESKNHYK